MDAILYEIVSRRHGLPEVYAHFGCPARSLYLEMTKDGGVEVEIREFGKAPILWKFEPSSVEVDFYDESEMLRIEDVNRSISLVIIDDELWLMHYDEPDGSCSDEDYFIGKALWREVATCFIDFKDEFDLAKERENAGRS